MGSERKRYRRIEQFHPGRSVGFLYFDRNLGVAGQVLWICAVPDGRLIHKRRRDDAQARCASRKSRLEMRGFQQPCRDDDGLTGTTHVAHHWSDVQGQSQLKTSGTALDAVV